MFVSRREKKYAPTQSHLAVNNYWNWFWQSLPKKTT